MGYRLHLELFSVYVPYCFPVPVLSCYALFFAPRQRRTGIYEQTLCPTGTYHRYNLLASSTPSVPEIPEVKHRELCTKFVKWSLSSEILWSLDVQDTRFPYCKAGIKTGFS